MRWNHKKTSLSIVLALLGGLGIIFLLAFQASSNYASALEKARNDNAHRSVLLSKQMASLIREADLLLSDLARTSRIDDAPSEAISARLQSVQSRLPYIENLALIQNNGTLAIQLSDDPKHSLAQDYFAQINTVEHITYSASAGSQKGLLITYRLQKANEPDGLLVARVSGEHLAALFAQNPHAAGQASFLLDQNLTPLIQYPSSAAAMLMMPSDKTRQNFKQTTASGHNSASIQEETSTLLTDFQKIPNTSFWVATSNPTASYLADWQKSIIYYLFAGVLVLALTLLMAFYFWRSQRLTRNLKTKEQKLSASEARFRQIIETTPVGLVLARMPDFYITYINQHAAKMFGIPQAAALSKRAYDFYYDKLDFIHHSDAALTEQPVNNAECLLKHKDGNPFWANLSMSAASANEGTTLVIGLSDITQRKRLEEELKRRATTDSLSGLANRAHFMETAQQEMLRAKRYRHRACILMLDIDFFKKVNDVYGHQTGDLVIQTMAHLCRASLRDNDLLARIGGEEFTAFLPETPLAEAFEVAERLRQYIEQNRIPLEDGRTIQFTCSIGISELRADDVKVETWIKRADEALYASKHGGRNQTSCFEQIS